MLTAPQTLNREFLEIRAKILEVAASLDRLERYEGEVAEDPRLARILEALRLLCQTDAQRRTESSGDRAENVQLIFSRTYEKSWPEQFGLVTKK